MAAKSAKKKNAIISELEGVVDVLSLDMTTAMDIKKEKENLKDKIRILKKEDGYLRDMVKHLKDTKSKLEIELQNKNHEEDSLKDDLKRTRSEKKKESSKNARLQAKVDKLVQDKKDLSASLVRMNDIIVKLKQHITDFDQGIKSTL
jgi:septal ring factor EnvC (AmiA/AmiB activator)